MVDSKTPNNIIKFPKKYKLHRTPKEDASMAKKIKHPLQPKIDKAVQSKFDNNDNVYAITIDYDKF